MSAALYILARLKEPSTWAGLGVMLGGMGIKVQPGLWQSIAVAGAAIAGLIATVLAEVQTKGAPPP